MQLFGVWRFWTSYKVFRTLLGISLLCPSLCCKIVMMSWWIRSGVSGKIRNESGDVGTSSSYWYKVLGAIRSFRSVSGMFRSMSGVFRSKSGVFQSVSDGPELVVVHLLYFYRSCLLDFCRSYSPGFYRSQPPEFYRSSLLDFSRRPLLDFRS